jgi:hypothetical protein
VPFELPLSHWFAYDVALAMVDSKKKHRGKHWRTSVLHMSIKIIIHPFLTGLVVLLDDLPHVFLFDFSLGDD